MLKILVRFPNWLGDLIMSIGFYNKLIEIFNNPKIYAISKTGISEILNLFGNFERIYEFSKEKYSKIIGIYKFSNEISNSYDIYFSLPDSFSSAFMGFFSNSKKRIGYMNEFREIFLTNAYKKPKNLHRVEEYCYLLKDFTKNPIENIKVQLNIEPENYIRNLNSKYKIVVNINSEAQSRRMSIPKWTKIIEMLLNELDCHVILTGSKKDINRVNWLFESLEKRDRVINLAGKTNLIELSRIIKASDIMLSSDSGPAHLSNALLVKTIVLFGAGDEKNTSPYNKDYLKVIRLNMSCSPCLKNYCKFRVPLCLEDLDENLIVKNLIKWL
ncbi:MAG: glycosyltransferase family 9 protein [candidate division WOR-3 bacterium]